jgi:O-antigen ligase
MNFFTKISRITFLIAVICTPLAVIPYSENAYLFGKFMFLGIFILVSLIFFILSFKENLEKQEIKIPHKLLLFFFGLSIFSHFFSTDIEMSVYSSFPRYSEGLIVDLIIFISIFLAINLFRKLNIGKLIFLSSIPVVFISIYQILYSSERIGSTFGQPNFLGIFLVLSIFSLFENYYKSYPVRTLLAIIPYISILISTSSLTSIFIFIGVFGFFLVKEKIQIPIRVLFIIIVLILAFSIFKGNILWMKLNDVLRQTIIAEHTFISDSFLIRNELWKKTFELNYNLAYLLQGHGSNTFIYFFEKNRPQELDSLSEYYLIFDKPHNYYLEIIFSQGILIFISFFYLSYKSLKIKSLNNYYLTTILLFIFFNWMDIYLKLIFFLIVSQNLGYFQVQVKSTKIFILIPIIIILHMLSRFLNEFKSYSNQSEYVFDKKITQDGKLNSKNLIFHLKTQNWEYLDNEFEYNLPIKLFKENIKEKIF